MAKRAATAKKRRYYWMKADMVRGDAPGMKMLNIETLATSFTNTINVKPYWKDGISASPDAGPWRFPDFQEKPRLLFDHKLGRIPRDLENYNHYWLISATMKAVLESLDPDALDFRVCETLLPSGEPGPARWLCTVTRAFLGAVNIEASEDLIIGRDPDGSPHYTPTALTKLKLRADVIGAAPFFHIIEILPTEVYCSQAVKDTCKEMKVTGVQFINDVEAI